MEFIDDDYFDLTFDGIEFTAGAIKGKNFSGCFFKDCSFIEADLTGISLADCSFNGCNLTTPVIRGSQLVNAEFLDCKLAGIDFSQCSSFLMSMSFMTCTLISCSFPDLRLPRTVFESCTLVDTEFSRTDLTKSSFSNSMFERCVFDETNLVGADFRGAAGFYIDPVRNRILSAKFDQAGALGLLRAFGIKIE